jgi:hypothetical protein
MALFPAGSYAPATDVYPGRDYPRQALFPSNLLWPGHDLFLGFIYHIVYKFTPPFVVREHIISGALRGALQYGITVMRIAGEWVEAEFPSWEQESSADVLLRGGTECTVDEATATDLTAAGYEPSLEYV